MISRVLKKKGVMVQFRGMMYKSVVKTVLLYGSKSLLVTGEMLNILEGFLHLEARRIMGMTETFAEDGSVNIPRQWRHWKQQVYTPFKSTFGDGRRPLRHRCNTTPSMSSIPRRSRGRGKAGEWDGGIRTWYMNLRSRQRICLISM